MHLSREDLQQWHAVGAAADRDRVVTHLAVCPACAAQLAEIARTTPAAAGPVTLDPAEFVDRGHTFAPGKVPHAAETTMSPSRRGQYWAFAAAAVLVLSVGTVLWTRPEPPMPVSVMRGADAAVTLMTPEDRADIAVPRDALVFEWTSSAPDLPVRLIVTSLATPDHPAIDRSGVVSGYRPSADERAALEPTITYRWYLEYRLDGEVLVTSARRFRVE